MTLLLPRKIIEAIVAAQASDVTGHLTLHLFDGAVLAYTCETKERMSNVDRGDLINVPEPMPQPRAVRREHS
jgi:hypothetical protein